MGRIRYPRRPDWWGFSAADSLSSGLAFLSFPDPPRESFRSTMTSSVRFSHGNASSHITFSHVHLHMLHFHLLHLYMYTHGQSVRIRLPAPMWAFRHPLLAPSPPARLSRAFTMSMSQEGSSHSLYQEPVDEDQSQIPRSEQEA